MSRLTLHLLGTPQIALDGKRVSGFVTRKAQALLIYLAHTGTVHTRDRLAGLFWPDMPDESAKNNLRRTLPNLRKLVGSHLAIDTQTVSLAKETDYWLDVKAFKETFSTSGDPMALMTIPLEELAAKTRLYQGDFLQGFYVSGLPEFEQWMLLEREHLRELVIRAMVVLADRYMQVGEIDSGLVTTRRLLDLEPWYEAAHQQQMLLLAHSGRRGAALAQYETCCTLLADEFGAEPSMEMRAYYERIKAGELDIISPIAPRNPAQSLIRSDAVEPRPSVQSGASPRVDWGEVAYATTLYGRQHEVDALRQWLTDDQYKVIGLLGIGGTGKTVLATHVVRLLAHSIQVGNSPKSGAMSSTYIIWRSLINKPPLSTIVTQWLQFLSEQELANIPVNLNEQLELLFELLRQKRCLLVLDNLESILGEGEDAGHFLEEHADYDNFLQRMAETEHRGCLLFTSRELPLRVSPLERTHLTVHSVLLKGLDNTSGIELLAAEGFNAAPENLSRLVERYSGNPLALKLMAETVRDLYGGDIEAFLRDPAIIFDDIRAVLHQQFTRLSTMEREILCWLAVEREPIALQHLKQNWIHAPPQRQFLEAIRSLQRRGLIERAADDVVDVISTLRDPAPRFTLQNVVMEFVSDLLIERIFQELTEIPLLSNTDKHAVFAQSKLNRYGLVKANSKAYIREIQTHLLLKPLLHRLLDRWGKPYTIEHLQRWIEHLRAAQSGLSGYAGANILQLLLQMDVDLKGWDFSRICIRQADLRMVTLTDINFQEADLTGSVFANMMGAIESVAVSPDGQYLASGGSDGTIYIWRKSDYQIHNVLHGHMSVVNTLCFSNDGSLLISSDMGATICVWEMESGRLVHSLTNPGRSLITIALHRDSIHLAAAFVGDVVEIWDWQRSEICYTLPTLSYIADLAFSPDGKLLVSVGDEREINVWSTDDFELRHTLKGHEGKTLAVAFNAQSDLFATGGEDGQIFLWDATTMQLQQVMPGHAGFVLALSFSAYGDYLASGSADQTVRTWELRTGKTQRIFRGHYGWVKTVVFSPNTHRLITGGYDQTIRVWETQSGQLLHAIKGHLKRVDFLRFSADGQLLAASSLDGSIYIWDVASARLRYLLHGPQAATRSLVFSRNGELLATASDDHGVRLWDTRSGRLKRILRGHTDFVRSLIFSPDERLLISGSHDRTLRIWEVSTGQLQQVIPNVNAIIQFAVVFSPTNQQLAYGTFDHTINVIDLNDGQIIHQFDIAPTIAMVLAFDPSGRRLACGAQDGQVLIYDLAIADNAKAPLHRIQSTPTPIWRVLFSPDGKVVAWNCVAQEMRRLNLESGKVSPAIFTYYGAFCLGFSHDSTQIFTDGADHTLLIRDAIGGEIHHTLRGHTAGLTSIEVSPVNGIIASSSADGSIRLWNLNTGACLAVLQFQGPYAGMNITGATGISDTQRRALLELGAIDEDTELYPKSVGDS